MNICLTTEQEIDKLESFSRRNNIRLFNVYEGSNEDDTSRVQKVVQLLNRFYSTKQKTMPNQRYRVYWAKNVISL